MNDKIDFVVLWVDGADPRWLAEKRKYDGTSGDSGENRYRDWDIFQYWFRGVEKYAPWVNKIHFVTWGHVPKWLNVEHEKLNVVRHDEYIPREYLPTFSSHPIELNLHRIKSLNEKFVLFNDDMFLLNETTESDFFKNELPVDEAVLYPITANDGNFQHILLNDAQFFVEKFNIKELLRRDRSKWINPIYGKSLLKTMCMLPYPEMSGIMLHHQPQSFLKSTLGEVWNEIPEKLEESCKHKFRNIEDVNQYVFRYWQLGKGKFVPFDMMKRGKYVSVDGSELDYNKLIVKSSYKIVCLNDCSISFDFQKEKKKIQDAFKNKFPEKCSFEL